MPIKITEGELYTLSHQTLRQIDDLNQEYEYHCIKAKK